MEWQWKDKQTNQTVYILTTTPQIAGLWPGCVGGLDVGIAPKLWNIICSIVSSIVRDPVAMRGILFSERLWYDWYCEVKVKIPQKPQGWLAF